MTIGAQRMANREAASDCGLGRSSGYRIKDTTIAIVSKPIVVSKTLWPQRAINPSMFNLPVTKSQKSRPGSGRASPHEYGCNSLQFKLGRCGGM
jgi:hypothetical protein